MRVQAGFVNPGGNFTSTLRKIVAGKFASAASKPLIKSLCVMALEAVMELDAVAADWLSNTTRLVNTHLGMAMPA